MDVDFANPKFTPSIPMTWPPVLTIDQTSKVLNISKWTLRNWDNQGKLKAIRFGARKDRRYKKDDVLKVLHEGLY